MDRTNICKNIIQSIKDYIMDPVKLEPHRAEKHFVRKRKLTLLHLYQAKMNKVIKTICKYGVFASVKEILEMDGFAFHGVRKPFTPMTEEGRKELRGVYEEIIIPNR